MTHLRQVCPHGNDCTDLLLNESSGVAVPPQVAPSPPAGVAVCICVEQAIHGLVPPVGRPVRMPRIPTADGHRFRRCSVYVWNKPSLALFHHWPPSTAKMATPQYKESAGVTRRRCMHNLRWWILAAVILLLALSTIFAPPSGRPKRPVDAWRKIKPPPPPPVPRGR